MSTPNRETLLVSEIENLNYKVRKLVLHPIYTEEQEDIEKASMRHEIIKDAVKIYRMILTRLEKLNQRPDIDDRIKRYQTIFNFFKEQSKISSSALREAKGTEDYWEQQIHIMQQQIVFDDCVGKIATSFSHVF